MVDLYSKHRLKRDKQLTQELESVLQVRCFSECRHIHKLHCWHTCNEGKRSIQSAVRQKAGGLLSGVSDLLILRNGVLGAFELKRWGGRLSDPQKLYVNRVIEEGGLGYVCYGFHSFKEALSHYLLATKK